MLGFQLRPGVPQACRQIIRHWPYLAAILTASAVVAASLLPGGPPAGGRPSAYRVPAADQLPMAAAPHAAALKELAAQRPGAPASYQVRPRDTLTAIAARLYGHANRWPALWWVNRHRVANPDALRIGTTLRLSSWHPDRAWIYRAALAAIPKPPPPPPAGHVSRETTSVSSTAAPVTSGGSGVGGSFGDCVRARESGGNYGAYNPNGHYGAYQFSAATWAAYGGNPADYGHASPAEQDRVFANAIAAGGQGNWSPYDGCSAGLSTAAALSGPVSHAFGAGVATPARHRFVPLRLLAFWQALRYRGAWYAWGGTGPSFDCSGLVYRSYLNLGHLLPRDTFGMLGGGGRLHFTSRPRKGMLAFFGSGHVELYVRPGVTYGAHHSGTRIGYRSYNRYYHPTAFMWVSRR